MLWIIYLGEIMSVIVQLRGYDLEQCDILAKQRNTKNKGVINRTIAKKKSSWETNFLGLLGEFAVAKYLGFGVDTNHNPHGGDGGSDFKYRGQTIDVKYVDMIDQPILMFKNIHKFRSDIAILTKPFEPHHRSKVVIMGWIDKDSFIKNHYIRDFGYGKTCCLDGRKLFNIDILKT